MSTKPRYLQRLVRLVRAAFGYAVMLFVATLIVLAIGSLFYLDFAAYKERFPHASAWSYFFQGGRK